MNIMIINIRKLDSLSRVWFGNQKIYKILYHVMGMKIIVTTIIFGQLM